MSLFGKRIGVPQTQNGRHNMLAEAEYRSPQRVLPAIFAGLFPGNGLVTHKPSTAPTSRSTLLIHKNEPIAWQDHVRCIVTYSYSRIRTQTG